MSLAEKSVIRAAAAALIAAAAKAKQMADDEEMEMREQVRTHTSIFRL